MHCCLAGSGLQHSESACVAADLGTNADGEDAKLWRMAAGGSGRECLKIVRDGRFNGTLSAVPSSTGVSRVASPNAEALVITHKLDGIALVLLSSKNPKPLRRAMCIDLDGYPLLLCFSSGAATGSQGI
jgi:hypothetical protein